MSGSPPARPAAVLAVLVSQYDRQRFAGSLIALCRVLDRLSYARPRIIVVDNAHPGDWSHEVREELVHIGGHNSAREFSAFDRGLEYLEREGQAPDLVVLATDAFLAYGDDYLDLITNDVLRCCHELGACAGWADAYPETCRVGGHEYRSWMRTSFLIGPTAAIAEASPIAVDLDDLRLFDDARGGGFGPQADLSENLQRYLLEWLTGRQARELEGVWHSRFDLDEESQPLFRAKVEAILREQLLSARLRGRGVPAYDFRGIDALARQGELDGFLRRGGDPRWQWLGWQEMTAAAEGAPEIHESSHSPRPLFAVVADRGDEGAARAISFLARKVLPLVRQRHGAAKLLVVLPDGVTAEPPLEGALEGVEVADLGSPDPGLLGAIAVVAPGDGAAPGRSVTWARDLGLPLVAGSVAADSSLRAGEEFLAADDPVELARACCRLIEEPGLGDELAAALCRAG